MVNGMLRIKSRGEQGRAGGVSSVSAGGGSRGQRWVKNKKRMGEQRRVVEGLECGGPLGCEQQKPR